MGFLFRQGKPRDVAQTLSEHKKCAPVFGGAETVKKVDFVTFLSYGSV